EKAQAYMRRQGSFEDQLVEGLIFLVRTGRNDPFVRLLVNPVQLEAAQQIVGATAAVVDLTHEMWEPILEEAADRGELNPALDFYAIARWLTHIELILVGRLDLTPDENDVRDMLRTFLAPAFAPVTARRCPARSGRPRPVARRGRRCRRPATARRRRRPPRGPGARSAGAAGRRRAGPDAGRRI